MNAVCVEEVRKPLRLKRETRQLVGWLEVLRQQMQAPELCALARSRCVAMARKRCSLCEIALPHACHLLQRDEESSSGSM
jgi:hypothetical protein